MDCGSIQKITWENQLIFPSTMENLQDCGRDELLVDVFDFNYVAVKTKVYGGTGKQGAAVCRL